MTIPQLRVRTEFTFRFAFGQIPRVAEVLAEMKCPAAAIVDPSTWGHVRWAKSLRKVGVRPLFGAELSIPRANGQRPTAWALAADSRAFYRFSTAARAEGADVEALFARSPGLVRFAGAALTDPATFDYIDINPGSALAQAAAMKLAAKTKKPLVLTSDNSYPAPSDHGAFMAIIDRAKVTPQHILSLAEMKAAFPFLSPAAFKKAVAATHEAAERCVFELPKAPLIQLDGDLCALALAGKKERLALKHIPKWTKEYEARLKRELEMISSKKFESYFIMVADLIRWAKERMLVGPARGSSAGSLVCYLLRITEVDPLVHDLLFERFIDVTRADLPDIDIDFNDQKRELIFEYLSKQYGRDKVARLGNVNLLKPRSLLAEACKRFGIPDRDRFDLVNVLEEHSSGSSLYGKGLSHAMDSTDVGRRFSERYPEAAVIGQAENHAWHTGVHAAGVVVCNDPVSDYCTVNPDGVAQLDKPDAEHLNLLKIDALGLRTLGVLEDTGVATYEELYALKLNDPEVFKIFNDRKFSGIFQFEGNAQRGVSSEIDINSFRRIDHVTALARPGPLGGGAASHYINRAAGREEVEYRHPTMEPYLSKTLGVVLYQEQVMRMVREIGQFSWEDTTTVRKAMSGRKGQEYFDQQGEKFIKGAATLGVKKQDAISMWSEICAFGAWGMNQAHTASYAIVSYWCAWMKRYHALPYAAACLRSAKDDDQAMEILREITREGIRYKPFDIDRSAANWAVVDGQLLGGFMNLVGVGPSKAATALEARASGRMDAKMRAKFAAMTVKFAELYPLQAKYAALYAEPEKFGCAEGSTVLLADQFPPSGDILFLGKLIKKKPRDKNEAVLIARREGKVMRPPTAFADFVLQDDSGVPIICRVDPRDYEPLGRVALEVLEPEVDEILVRGRRVPNYPMITVRRMRVLNREQELPI